jgi:hypothetical protein
MAKPRPARARIGMVQRAIRLFEAGKTGGKRADQIRECLRQQLELYKVANRAHRKGMTTGFFEGSRPVEKQSLKEYERLLTVYRKMLRPWTQNRNLGFYK